MGVIPADHLFLTGLQLRLQLRPQPRQHVRGLIARHLRADVHALADDDVADATLRALEQPAQQEAEQRLAGGRVDVAPKKWMFS